jgi:hypothetical protein
MNRKIRYFIRKSELLERAIEEMGEEEFNKFPALRETMTKGWGNGYAVIPPGHPLFGQENPDLNVHGGITWSASVGDVDWPELLPEERNCWVVGFDTAHAFDTPERCDRAYVENEAKRLAEQLEAMWPVT